MSEGKRPGGLTALAVLNFIAGGFGALAVVGLIAILTALNLAEPPDELKEGIEVWKEIGTGLLYFSLLFEALTSALLIASGVGYIKQKRFLGRTLGNAYAVASIIAKFVGVMMIRPEVGGGFSIATIIGLVYPALTLLLLNMTFKHDFTR